MIFKEWTQYRAWREQLSTGRVKTLPKLSSAEQLCDEEQLRAAEEMALTGGLLNVHELDVLCKILQQGLAVLLPIGMEDVRQRKGDLSVYRCLCSKHRKQESQPSTNFSVHLVPKTL